MFKFEEKVPLVYSEVLVHLKNIESSNYSSNEMQFLNLEISNHHFKVVSQCLIWSERYSCIYWAAESDWSYGHWGNARCHTQIRFRSGTNSVDMI